MVFNLTSWPPSGVGGFTSSLVLLLFRYHPTLRQSLLYSLDDLAGGKLGFDDVAVDAKVLELFRGFFVTEVSEDDNWDGFAP